MREGDSHNILADARSDLMHFTNALRGHLPDSQRLLLAWRKMNCQSEQIPCRAFFACHGRRIAMSLFDRFPRCLEKHRNHLHSSIALHLPTSIWTCIAGAATDIIGTTLATCPTATVTHPLVRACVWAVIPRLQPGQRRLHASAQAISKMISQFGTVGAPSSILVASILFETRRSHGTLHRFWHSRSNNDVW